MWNKLKKKVTIPLLQNTKLLFGTYILLLYKEIVKNCVKICIILKIRKVTRIDSDLWEIVLVICDLHMGVVILAMRLDSNPQRVHAIGEPPQAAKPERSYDVAFSTSFCTGNFFS